MNRPDLDIAALVNLLDEAEEALAEAKVEYSHANHKYTVAQNRVNDAKATIAKALEQRGIA